MPHAVAGERAIELRSGTILENYFTEGTSRELKSSCPAISSEEQMLHLLRAMYPNPVHHFCGIDIDLSEADTLAQ